MINPIRLVQQLNNTGLQNKDTPLYQFLKELIRALSSLTSEIATVESSGGSSDIINQLMMNLTELAGADGQDGMSIIGPIGPKGADGSRGLDGQDGLDGMDGMSIIGPQGPRGIDGLSLAMLFGDTDGYDNDLMPFRDVLGPFKKGSVLFQGDGKITEDNANLFWDDANNYLGIGTSSPGTALDVRGNAIQFLAAGGDTGQLVTASGQVLLKNVSAGSLLFGTNNTTKMTIDSSGQVGIGVAPTSTVQLVIDKGVNSSNVMQLSGSGIATFQMATDSGPDVTLKNTSNGRIFFGTNNTTRITIAADGKVGINKAPSVQLDISGDTDVNGNLTYDTAAVFSWVSKSVDTVYQAASDGLVVFSVVDNLVNGIYTGVTDSSNPPTTTRCVAGTSLSSGAIDCSFTMPVKKGDYWKVITSSGTGTITLFWVPLGLNG